MSWRGRELVWRGHRDEASGIWMSWLVLVTFNGYDNLGRVPTQHRYHPSGEHERSLCLTLCITCIRDSDRCVDIEQ